MPTVKSIDVYSIHERLRKDKTKEGKELWNYVKKLNEALVNQQQLTGKAIGKLREISIKYNETQKDKEQKEENDTCQESK